jgi:Bifunctional DNA primase/polymerase, N-terminal
MQRIDRLIYALWDLPEEWLLTPVRDKNPCRKQWLTTPCPKSQITEDLTTGFATGFALLNGAKSGGILAVDCDGEAPHQLFKEILGGEIPCTVAFTSTRQGRAQYLFKIDPTYWDRLRTKIFRSTDGMLEFRWNKSASVLPPSAHPDTHGYEWIYPPATGIVPLPDRALDYWLKATAPVEIAPAKPHPRQRRASTGSTAIPIERCLSLKHRQVLAQGVGEGDRDNTGYRLAMDLIGVANHVPEIQFEYRHNYYQLTVDGDPESLLWEYCQRCTPPLSRKDCDRIYRSAQGYSPTPSIASEEVLANCLRSWWKETLLSH